MDGERYFYGNKVSDYGVEQGYVDYRCLSKAFNAILANDLMSNTYGIGYWEIESGDGSNEVFQWYIVDDNGADILKEIDEIVYYNEELDISMGCYSLWYVMGLRANRY